MQRTVSLFLFAFLASPLAAAEELQVICWNIESRGSSPPIAINQRGRGPGKPRHSQPVGVGTIVSPHWHRRNFAVQFLTNDTPPLFEHLSQLGRVTDSRTGRVELRIRARSHHGDGSDNHCQN